MMSLPLTDRPTTTPIKLHYPFPFPTFRQPRLFLCYSWWLAGRLLDFGWLEYKLRGDGKIIANSSSVVLLY